MAAAATVALALAFTASAVASPQPLANQTAAWLTATLGVEVRPQAVGAIQTDAHRPWVAASYPDRGERYILAEDWLVGDWQRPRRADFSPESGRLLIHELLHGISLDEGAVDAVAIDLLPAWTARFTPQVDRDHRDLTGGGVSYPRLVRAVRAASAKATGQPWRSREARLWRRGHLIETGMR